MQINIEVSNLDKIEQKLKEIEHKGSNMLPLFKEIGNSIKNTTEATFENQKDAFGNSWIPSKKATGLTLIKSGALSGSFVPFATKSSVTVGTNLIYAPIHQFGGRAGRGKKVLLPARPFLPIDNNNNIPNDLKEEILDNIEDFFKK